ncbi:BNR/Asp-box repeat protein, partial [mine drainage metagenome]
AVAAPAVKGEAPWVPGQAGLHRIYWNLHAQGPVRWRAAPKYNRGPRNGALMPPGIYTATLEIGGAKASQSFTVVNDPASTGTLAGMTERCHVTAAVLHEISRIDVALNRLHAIRVQLAGLRAAVRGLPERSAVDTAIGKLARARRTMLLKLTSDAGSSESTLWVPDRIHEKLMALEQLLQGSDE